MASLWPLIIFCNLLFNSLATDQIAKGSNRQVDKTVKIDDLLALAKRFMEESMMQKTSHVPRPKGLASKQDSYYRLFFDQSREMAMKGRKGMRPTYKDLCCIHTWPPNIKEHVNKQR